MQRKLEHSMRMQRCLSGSLVRLDMHVPLTGLQDMLLSQRGSCC